MKGTNADDFRSLSLEDLDNRIFEMKKQMFNLRMQLHSNQLTNTNELKETRKDIARAETVRGEKTREAETVS
ncbi:MAG: 50S ribosomal protein L29 [Candidatus Hinthialibacter antarcticus]|nr:50S ribosomal protein L29 [Candidatus Hinthialibacter antarcticus]